MTDEEFKTIAAAILSERAACARIARHEAHHQEMVGMKAGRMREFKRARDACERIARAIERGEK
jgi:hypothetical protein